MFKPKQKGLLLLICVSVVVLGFVAVASAAHLPFMRPGNITMDFVPQNFGVYDTYYCNFQEADCRACHGTTTAWRHHATETAVRGDCTYCHWNYDKTPPNPYTNPIRDCLQCHIDSGPLGDLAKPHHRSALASMGSCTACHSSDLVSDANSVPKPQFDPTTITPTPYSCENCHWPKAVVPRVDNWDEWSGFPKPSYTVGVATPAPIEANGPMNNGFPNPAKTDGILIPPGVPPGTHHDLTGVVGKPGISERCYFCHSTSQGGVNMTDNVELYWYYQIRGCENCHDIYTLHNGITEHTTDGLGGSPFGINYGGYTVGGVTNQVVLQNQKCVACHGDEVTQPMPADPGVIPVINHLEPPMGSVGITVSIIGSGFLAPGQVQKGDDDVVQMQQGVYGWIDIDVPSSSWGPDKIQFQVPGVTFTAGDAYVRVVKKYWRDGLGGVCDPGDTCTEIPRTSGTALFTVRQHPILTFLNPDSGNWGTGAVTINAQPGSFGIKREVVFNVSPGDGGYPGTWTGYGYSTYVEIVASNDKYRFTEMSGSGWSGDSGLAAWNNASIQVRLAPLTAFPTLIGYGNLLDTQTNMPVPLADLYKGNWQLYVVTDYFKDDGDGVYILRHPASGHLMGRIDPGDTLLYREISDPLPFFATEKPFISSVNPVNRNVKGGTLFALYGIKFGTTRDTSFVEASLGCTGIVTTAYPAPLYYQWANTRIVLRAPSINNTGCLRVVVPKVCNPAGSCPDQNSNWSQPITIHTP